MAQPKPNDPNKPKDGNWFTNTPWARALLIWGGIGIFLLFFGGVAAQGYMRLVSPCPNDPSCPGAFLTRAVLLGLIYLSVGGGVALGLVGVALTLANPRGVGWGLGILVVGAVLFLVFVWPTPYKYYRANDHQLIRIHRVTGASSYVP